MAQDASPWDSLTSAYLAGVAFKNRRQLAAQQQEARDLEIQMLRHNVEAAKINDKLHQQSNALAEQQALSGMFEAPGANITTPQATPMQSYPGQLIPPEAIGGQPTRAEVPLNMSVPFPLSSGGTVNLPVASRFQVQQAAQQQLQDKLANEEVTIPEGGVRLRGGKPIFINPPKPPATPPAEQIYTQFRLPALIEAHRQSGIPLTAADVSQDYTDFTSKQTAPANPPANIADYNLYVDQTTKAGGKPMSFLEYQKQLANLRPQQPSVTISMVDDPNNPGRQMPVAIDKRALTATPITGTGGIALGKSPVAELNRISQAQKVLDYSQHVINLINANPGAVGPIAGRIARGERILGNISPGAQAVGTALGSLIALQPILHGFRGGSQTMDHFNSLIGDQHLNADALKAGIQEIQTLATQIKGGKAQEVAPEAAPAAGWSVKVKK